MRNLNIYTVLILIAFIIAGCNPKDDSSDMPQTEDKNPIQNRKMLFIIAGQSNAEGNVFVEGLELLKEAIPTTEGTLSSEERTNARIAVANSLGVFCNVDPDCISNPNDCPNAPFDFSTADAVIDGLRNSSIDWRSVSTTYQHPNVLLRAANFSPSSVLILDTNGNAVDNENCTASPTNTTLSGPVLNRFTPETTQLLQTGLGVKTFAGEGETSFGPEISFGLEMAKEISEPIILKVTMGGSSLNDHWRKTGTLYQKLLEETQEVLTETSAELGGLIWFQGFNDQFEGVYCQSLSSLYENNLQGLFSNLRADLGSQSLPIVVVESRIEGELAIISQAQNNVVNSDSRTSIIPSNDLSKCFHYGAGSQILIGEKAGKAMRQLIQ